jgi:hypothetical protein
MDAGAGPGEPHDTSFWPAEADALAASYRVRLGPLGAFLPERVPAFAALPEPFAGYYAVTAELADRYHQPAGGVRKWLDGLFGQSRPDVVAAATGADPATKAGIFGILTVLAHLYRWDTVPPAATRFTETELRLPEGIGRPWMALCDEVGLPHVGTLWSFVLCNWTLPGREGDAYDAGALPDQGLRLGCRWLRPPADTSQENFHLAFLCVEAKGGPAIALAVDAVEASLRQDADGLVDALTRLESAIDDVTGQFVDRIRASRVPLEGWLDLIQPTFAWGLPGDDGQPLSGPGGLQLGVVHVLDAVLGLPAGSTMAKASRGSRRYFPTFQREFLAELDTVAPRVREFVLGSGRADVKRAFNGAVRALRRFRVVHRVQGARYLRAGGQEGAPRMSSGTGISWREDPSRPEVEPADLFERQMLDRMVETTDALAPGAGEPSDLRAPEISFRFLERPQLRALLKLAERRAFPRGSVIVSAGVRSEAMYLLVEGTASVVAPFDGAPPIATLWPGELFAELSFLGAVPSRSVIAGTDVVVDVLHGEAVHALLESDPALAAGFYRSLAVLVARRLNADTSTGGWTIPAGEPA